MEIIIATILSSIPYKLTVVYGKLLLSIFENIFERIFDSMITSMFEKKFRFFGNPSVPLLVNAMPLNVVGTVYFAMFYEKIVKSRQI